MLNFTLDLYKKSALHRYIVLGILVFCTLNLFAQRDIPQRIYDVLISKDTKAAQKLILQITENDITQMADSTLLDYYYLAGWVALEGKQYNKGIDFLIKIKELCETKVGIENQIFVYFEILKALGETCEEIGKDDEALLWYEEGVVKGLPYLDTTTEPLKSSLDAIRDNAAEIYEKRGHADMAEFFRSDKPIDYIGSPDYAHDLFSQVSDLYDLYGEENCSDNGNEAIKLLDEAKVIYQKHSNESKEWMPLLYREYLLCYASMGDTKQIDRLIRTKRQIMYIGDDKPQFVKDMRAVMVSFIFKHHDIETAEKYCQYALKWHDKSNRDIVADVTKLGEQLQFYKQLYSQMDSLQQIRSSRPAKDYEWGIVSLQLSNILINIRREKEAYNICEDIYAMSSKLQEDPRTLHWAVLMNLADYGIVQKEYSIAERYSKEQMAWLDAHNYAENAEKRGWVYNKLGIVYMNSSRYDDSEKAFLKAEEIFFPIYKKESSEYATIIHNRGRLAQLQGKFDEAKELLTEAQQIQIVVEGKPKDRTVQYLNEVEQAIKTRL